MLNGKNKSFDFISEASVNIPPDVFKTNVLPYLPVDNITMLEVFGQLPELSLNNWYDIYLSSRSTPFLRERWYSKKLVLTLQEYQDEYKKQKELRSMTKFEFFILKYYPLITFGSEKFNPAIIYDHLYWTEEQKNNTALMSYFLSLEKENPYISETQNEKEYLYWYDNKKKIYQDFFNTKHLRICTDGVTFKNNINLYDRELELWLDQYAQYMKKLETFCFEYGEFLEPTMSYLGRRKESKDKTKGFRPKSLKAIGLYYDLFPVLLNEYKNQPDFLLGISILLIEDPPYLDGPDDNGGLKFSLGENFDQFLSGFFRVILTSKIKILILNYYQHDSYLSPTSHQNINLNDEENIPEYQNDLKIAKGAKIEPFVQEEFEKWSKEFKLLFFNTEEDTKVNWNSIIYQFLVDRGVTVRNYL